MKAKIYNPFLSSSLLFKPLIIYIDASICTEKINMKKCPILHLNLLPLPKWWCWSSFSDTVLTLICYVSDNLEVHILFLSPFLHFSLFLWFGSYFKIKTKGKNCLSIGKISVWQDINQGSRWELLINMVFL